MESVRLGNVHAFEVLICRHQKSIHNFIFRFMGNRSDAEDLTQEVFMSVWKTASTYKPDAKFTTWLYRIATNLSINLQRRNRIRRWFAVSEKNQQEQYPNNAHLADEGKTKSTPEDDILRSELSHHVRKTLDELPNNQRLAIILKVYNGLSYLEISRILGRSTSAVDALLIRAKKNLKKKLMDKNKTAGF